MPKREAWLRVAALMTAAWGAALAVSSKVWLSGGLAEPPDNRPTCALIEVDSELRGAYRGTDERDTPVAGRRVLGGDAAHQGNSGLGVSNFLSAAGAPRDPVPRCRS